MNIVLLNPEIPYNTGNIGRTSVLTNTKLHLIKPLGFSLDEKQLKRAGLDYWHLVDLVVWESYEEFIQANPNARIFYATTKTNQKYSDIEFKDDDFVMFGPESRGIPEEILDANKETCITIPMIDMGRSLNLSNSAAIILYEALRQNNFNFKK
ncbi:tRNA (uridine(34)/cytosine(34)/5-carboxymethylaminomethyluridine(34)-2'-O)-methyltransferase TrmL [Fusobacterium mortiferum]|uniref:Putative tRNA (cytidine(34)-2'-O)-methyltransferase n=2 Tax=Fusobacterium TaxID=848 RepID=A0ABS2G2G3_FUSMR|nr:MULTISPECIES: tRNA (uridine(34)/cytosine(34)/5-carboxymethylaminomethyluridine(34)-2'-O)-methyltransferase TrmL [Fusobacterium]MBU3842425.1 tRNA (uridine(34)/cytosine(34)/5-carboxymethylaminomethyluridine(34)-2'-O)-methyltransferase TrmL [Candidatus Fusobacterium pullicola]MBM6689951.1 tRNA (uridine(34)/cytosine(34)/5-carboxymethylaminomethyluridine(34)-2'-O)-methyltransferase TrmL [Fusobacterium mortiferum]MBM6822954.1 tRNA (uridine(34)/cytosine(34)/5-carboxymethylaminomethyluridine(34)-2'-O